VNHKLETRRKPDLRRSTFFRHPVSVVQSTETADKSSDDKKQVSPPHKLLTLGVLREQPSWRWILRGSDGRSREHSDFKSRSAQIYGGKETGWRQMCSLSATYVSVSNFPVLGSLIVVNV
jgi:hypothetical protein